MKKKIISAGTLIVIGILLGVMLLVGCSNTNQGGPSNNSDPNQEDQSNNLNPETLTVTDMFGRKVTVPSNLDRVVVIGGALNHMNWLQVGDKVVGVEEIETRSDDKTGGRVYRWAYPGYGGLPSVGPAAQPNAEMILSANPQVVFFASLTMDPVVNLQNQMNVPVVGLTYPEFGEEHDNFYKQLRLVAKVMNREDRAEFLVDWINQSLTDLSERSALPADYEKPGCYVGGILQGPQGSGFTSTMPYYPSFTMLNVNNVITADDLGLMIPGSLGRYTVDIEFITSKNPDFIFIDRAGTATTTLQYQNNKVVFDKVKAIANGNVYGLLPWHTYNNNVETMFINAYFIGKVLYPEKFTDIDPVAKAEEIYKLWYGNAVYDDLSNALGGGLDKFDLS